MSASAMKQQQQQIRRRGPFGLIMLGGLALGTLIVITVAPSPSATHVSTARALRVAVGLSGGDGVVSATNQTSNVTRDQRVGGSPPSSSLPPPSAQPSPPLPLQDLPVDLSLPIYSLGFEGTRCALGAALNATKMSRFCTMPRFALRHGAHPLYPLAVHADHKEQWCSMIMNHGVGAGGAASSTVNTSTAMNNANIAVPQPLCGYYVRGTFAGRTATAHHGGDGATGSGGHTTSDATSPIPLRRVVHSFADVTPLSFGGPLSSSASASPLGPHGAAGRPAVPFVMSHASLDELYRQLVRRYTNRTSRSRRGGRGGTPHDADADEGSGEGKGGRGYALLGPTRPSPARRSGKRRPLLNCDSPVAFGSPLVADIPYAALHPPLTKDAPAAPVIGADEMRRTIAFEGRGGNATLRFVGCEEEEDGDEVEDGDDEGTSPPSPSSLPPPTSTPSFEYLPYGAPIAAILHHHSTMRHRAKATAAILADRQRAARDRHNASVAAANASDGSADADGAFVSDEELFSSPQYRRGIVINGDSMSRQLFGHIVNAIRGEAVMVEYPFQDDALYFVSEDGDELIHLVADSPSPHSAMLHDARVLSLVKRWFPGYLKLLGFPTQQADGSPMPPPRLTPAQQAAEDKVLFAIMYRWEQNPKWPYGVQHHDRLSLGVGGYMYWWEDPRQIEPIRDALSRQLDGREGRDMQYVYITKPFRWLEEIRTVTALNSASAEWAMGGKGWWSSALDRLPSKVAPKKGAPPPQLPPSDHGTYDEGLTRRMRTARRWLLDYAAIRQAAMTRLVPPRGGGGGRPRRREISEDELLYGANISSVDRTHYTCEFLPKYPKAIDVFRANGMGCKDPMNEALMQWLLALLLRI